MSNVSLWDFEEVEARKYVKVPAWIEQDITLYTIEAVYEGNCSSGAYMPAVDYYESMRTMAAFGDQVLEYIIDTVGSLPEIDSDSSWNGIGILCLSEAVELRVASVRDEIIAEIEEELEEIENEIQNEIEK
jgi:hypothetical protein